MSCRLLPVMNIKVPKMCLVTVTYQSGEVLRPFLECVRAQTLPEAKLVVVDNASKDNTLKVLEQFAVANSALIANKENLGVAAGNNQGIRYALEAGAEWVLLINNDTEFPPDLCQELLRVARDHACRVLVPAISYFDSPESMWYSGGSFTWRRGAILTRHSEDPLPERPVLRVVDYAPTCCMLVHRSVFEQIGLMDEAYFVYWDDTDFCWRLRRAGVPIHMYTGAVLAHKVSKLTGGARSPFTIRYVSRNQVYFLRKHFPQSLARLCVVSIRLKNLVRRLIGMDSKEELRMRQAAVTEGWNMPLP